MSISSPSPGTPVPYYRHGNTSTASHQSEREECVLMNYTMNDSGKSALTVYSILLVRIEFCDIYVYSELHRSFYIKCTWK